MESMMLLGVVFGCRVNPNNGDEYFLDLNDPRNKDKLIRWEMKLKDKDIHAPKNEFVQ